MQQEDLFGGTLVPVGSPRPRPPGEQDNGAAEYYQVLTGQWSVVVYAHICKNGFGHLVFPHFWADRDGRPIWRVGRHGELPGDTYLFDSRGEAEEIVTMAYGQNVSQVPMSWVEVPTDDGRRRHNAWR